MFKRDLDLDLDQTSFAIGEALAHLHWLWFDGRLVRSWRDDGIYRFSADSRNVLRTPLTQCLPPLAEKP